MLSVWAQGQASFEGRMGLVLVVAEELSLHGTNWFGCLCAFLFPCFLFLPLIESELKSSSLTQRPLQEGECDGLEQVVCCKPGPVLGLLSSNEVRLSPGALRKAFGLFRHRLMFSLCFWLFVYSSPWTHSLAQVTQVVWGLCGRKLYNRKCRHKFTVI